MANPLQLLAGPMGLEPTPSGLTGRRYNQLNYRRIHLRASPCGTGLVAWGLWAVKEWKRLSLQRDSPAISRKLERSASLLSAAVREAKPTRFSSLSPSRGSPSYTLARRDVHVACQKAIATPGLERDRDRRVHFSASDATNARLACFSHIRPVEREMSPTNPRVGPKMQQMRLFRRAGVVGCSQKTTPFFTGCESDSRWRVSAMKQTGYSNVFA